MQRPLFPRRPPRTLLQDLYERTALHDISSRQWSEWHSLTPAEHTSILAAFIERFARREHPGPRMSREEIRELLLSPAEEADA